MPSKATLAEGAFRKQYGRYKGDMILSRMSKEKRIQLWQRMKEAKKI